MFTFSNIKETKVFSSDLQTAMEHCAQAINSRDYWSVLDFDAEKGVITCVWGKFKKGFSKEYKDDYYCISLKFSTTREGTKCDGSIACQLFEGNPFAKLIAKKLIKALFEII